MICCGVWMYWCCVGYSCCCWMVCGLIGVFMCCMYVCWIRCCVCWLLLLLMMGYSV